MKMRWHKFVSVCFSLFLLLSMFGNFVPKANATLNGDNFVTEITTAPVGIDVVDVDGEGRLFAIADNDIWRSLDQGATWTKVKDNPAPTGFALTLFVDSRDYVFAVTETASHNHVIQRSTDAGQTWTDVLSGTPRLWEMDEMSNGSLYINTYSSGGIGWIYKSDDAGATWTVWQNLTAQGWNIDHIHAIGIDDYTDDIYIVTGDGQYNAGVWRWNVTSNAWDTIANSTTIAAEWQFTKIMFDENYVYFLADGQPINYRMPKTGTSYKDFQAIQDLRWSPRVDGNFVFAYYHQPNDVYLFGTDEGQIWGSWDGQHWVKIYDIGDGNTFRQFTHRRPIYLSDSETNKLYRVDITKEDIIQLYYAQHNQYRGSLTNAENYVLEQRIWNGTNYLDLTKVALTNVQVSIIGLSRKNYAPIANSGFEKGNTSGWTISGSPLGGVTTAEKKHGTYSYTVQKSVGDTYNTILKTGFIDGSQGDIYVVSFWHKANTSVSQAINLFLYNGTGATLRQQYLTSRTTWTKFTIWHPLPPSSTSARWVIYFTKKDVTHYLDSVMMFKLEVGIAKYKTQGESFSNFESFTTVYGAPSNDANTGNNPVPYFDNLINTTNPNITIAGQQISYAGELANGTETTPQNLSGILTGAVKVTVNIGGSGQAILKITGTRILYEDSIILQGRTSNVYYGRYYGTLSISTNTSDLIALTNLQANLTSLTYSPEKLTLTIHSPSQTTSITKVYCGDKGKPEEVDGAASWSYDEPSKILTITANHTDPEIILILKWLPGDIDDDGDVDLHDFYLYAKAYGSSIGEPAYEPKADIDNDGDIDSDDLYLFAESYGKTI